MFLKTIEETEAVGRTAEIYQALKAQTGFVMEAWRCWTTRPDLLPAYQEFSDKIRKGFSLSRAIGGSSLLSPPRRFRQLIARMSTASS
jgi:hypothetical protein